MNVAVYRIWRTSEWVPNHWVANEFNLFNSITFSADFVVLDFKCNKRIFFFPALDSVNICAVTSLERQSSSQLNSSSNRAWFLIKWNWNHYSIWALDDLFWQITEGHLQININDYMLVKSPIVKRREECSRRHYLWCLMNCNASLLNLHYKTAF